MRPSQQNLSNQISADPVFSSLQDEIQHYRKQQQVKWPYVYGISGTIQGGTSSSLFISIEQGTDFLCDSFAISAFSYDGTGIATTYPIPTTAAFPAAWAARGLTLQITDSRSGRTFSNGAIPIELIGAPGYGLSLTRTMPFRNCFYQNTQIKLLVANTDNSARTHNFAIAFIGHKYMVPEATN